MSSYSCRPNRKRVNYYKNMMNSMGYEAKIVPLGVIGGIRRPHSHTRRSVLEPEHIKTAVSLVRMIRPKLGREFRFLPDDDLIPSGICLVAKKPAQGKG